MTNVIILEQRMLYISKNWKIFFSKGNVLNFFFQNKNETEHVLSLIATFFSFFKRTCSLSPLQFIRFFTQIQGGKLANTKISHCKIFVIIFYFVLHFLPPTLLRGNTHVVGGEGKIFHQKEIDEVMQLYYVNRRQGYVSVKSSAIQSIAKGQLLFCTRIEIENEFYYCNGLKEPKMF